MPQVQITTQYRTIAARLRAWARQARLRDNPAARAA
jgi:hypothetical protein